MAKKSLTDLLREEVQKSPDQEAENDQNLTTAGEQSQMNIPNQSRTRNSSPTKAELEATVVKLKAALETAKKEAESPGELKDILKESQEKEAGLKQQITELQYELEQHKQTVTQLQTALKKLEPLKTELEQAKTAALQLAEVNEKLSQEITTLKQDNKNVKANKSAQPASQQIARSSQYGRPIQKESDKPADFAKNSWLL